MVLIEALTREKNLTRKSIQKTLREDNFKVVDGATGTIEFCSNNGNRKNPPIRLVRVVEEKGSLQFKPIKKKPYQLGDGCY